MTPGYRLLPGDLQAWTLAHGWPADEVANLLKIAQAVGWQSGARWQPPCGSPPYGRGGVERLPEPRKWLLLTRSGV